MKPFFIKLSLFALGLMLLFPLKTIYLLKNDRYKKMVLGHEIYLSIEKSKKRNKNAKILIIGDSVGQQLFKNDTYNDSIYSLACNQSISLGGHYILLEDFLKINPEVQKVVLIYNSKAFKNNLDQQYTFQYFLKPFYNDEYKSRFSPSMMAEIKKVPFYYLSQFPPVLTSNWTPDWDFSKTTNEYSISPLSAEFMTKIQNLCKDKQLKFIILPCPTRESYKPVIANFRNGITYTGYDFNDYFSRITYVPDSCFLDDVHLKDPEKFRQEYIKIMTDL